MENMQHRRPLTASRPLAAGLLLALTSALPACDDPVAPEASFDLSLSPGSVAVGDFLEATLTNRGDGTGFYDFCDAPLQIREGGEWVTLRSLRLCLLRFSSLAPDETVTAPILMERAGVVRVAVPVKTSEGTTPDTLFSREVVVSDR
jgi:hypothetical protein